MNDEQCCWHQSHVWAEPTKIGDKCKCSKRLYTSRWYLHYWREDWIVELDSEFLKIEYLIAARSSWRAYEAVQHHISRRTAYDRARFKISVKKFKGVK